MNTSKAAVTVSAILGKVASIIGYALGGFSLIVIVMALADIQAKGAFESGIVFVIVLAICVFLIRKGMVIKRRIKRFKQYVAFISNDHMTSIINLAGATGQSSDFVKKDVEKMINKKFFVNAAIDQNSGEIVIGNKTLGTNFSNSPTQPNNSADTELVVCKGCGATNSKLKGIPASCEYCGTAL